MTETYKNFGEYVRRWRKEKGLTQQELAEQIGKTKSYVSNIERNELHPVTSAPPRPRIEVVDKIARMLARPVAEAREMAGYGIKENASTLSDAQPGIAPPQSTEAPTDLEGLLIYYFRALPPEVRPDLIAVAAAYYKQAQMSPGQLEVLAAQKKRAYDQLGLQEGEELGLLPSGVG